MLTLGTVSVSAGVVRNLNRSTLCAGDGVFAEGFSSAIGNSLKHTLLVSGKSIGNLDTGELLSDDISDIKTRFSESGIHYFQL